MGTDCAIFIRKLQENCSYEKGRLTANDCESEKIASAINRNHLLSSLFFELLFVYWKTANTIKQQDTKKQTKTDRNKQNQPDFLTTILTANQKKY